MLIGYVVAGVVRRQAADQAAVFGPGDVAVLKQPGQAYSGRSESACVRIVSFESSVLDEVADGLPDRAPVPVRFTGMTAVSAAAAKRLRSTVDFAWDLVAGNPAAADQPLVTGSTARLLAAAALSTFPNTAATEPDPGRPPRRQPRHAEPGHRVHRGARRGRPEHGGHRRGRERQHPRRPAGLPP